MIDFDIILRPNMKNRSVDTTPHDITNTTPYYIVWKPRGVGTFQEHIRLFSRTHRIEVFLLKLKTKIVI